MLRFFGGLVIVVALHLTGVSLASAAAVDSSAHKPNRLTTAQIEQLVSPIALYPDGVLAQILLAATYPLEVAQAAHWSQENLTLTGKELEDAMVKQMWNPAVKGLTAAPEVLQMMNEKQEWTQQLGDAFLAQQEDVLNAIQALRRRADVVGNLRTTAYQMVTKTPKPRTSGGTAALAQVITIVPTNPEMIYTPIYDPAVVYGPWPYEDYLPPFYWYPPGYVAPDVIGFATGFGAGSIWANVDWRRKKLFINGTRYSRLNHIPFTGASLRGVNAIGVDRYGIRIRNRTEIGRSAAPSGVGPSTPGKRAAAAAARQSEATRVGRRLTTRQRMASRGEKAPQHQVAKQPIRGKGVARNRSDSGQGLAARPRSGSGFAPGGSRFGGIRAGRAPSVMEAGAQFRRGGVGPRFGGVGQGPFGAAGGFRTGAGGHFGGIRRR